MNSFFTRNAPTFFAASIVALLSDKVVSPSIVLGKSMYPTFNPDADDSLIPDVIAMTHYDRFDAKTGDVVCFRSPIEPDKVLIKRIMATEGEWVGVNIGGFMARFQIPVGKVWVEGDNPNHSIDSRRFGAISRGLIVGRAKSIIFPFSHAKILRRDEKLANRSRVDPPPSIHTIAVTAEAELGMKRDAEEEFQKLITREGKEQDGYFQSQSQHQNDHNIIDMDDIDDIDSMYDIDNTANNMESNAMDHRSMEAVIAKYHNTPITSTIVHKNIHTTNKLDKSGKSDQLDQLNQSKDEFSLHNTSPTEYLQNSTLRFQPSTLPHQMTISKLEQPHSQPQTQSQSQSQSRS